MDAWIAFLMACASLLVYFFVLPFKCRDNWGSLSVHWIRKGVIGAALLLLIFLALSRIQQTRARPRVGDEQMIVWVNTRSGFYYCPSTKFYRKLRPGKFMAQREALQSGYQPSGG